MEGTRRFVFSTPFFLLFLSLVSVIKTGPLAQKIKSSFFFSSKICVFKFRTLMHKYYFVLNFWIITKCKSILYLASSKSRDQWTNQISTHSVEWQFAGNFITFSPSITFQKRGQGDIYKPVMTMRQMSL